MKRLILIFLLAPILVNAENITTSKITNVTVYQSGARITNQATIALKPGNNEVIVTDLTNSINTNSVQVKLFGNAILLSATSRTRIKENEELPKRTKVLNDSLNDTKNKISWLMDQKEVYNGEGKVISENQKLGTNEQKASVEEIIRLSEFYRSRLMDIKKKVHNIDEDIRKLNIEKQTIERKLNELKYLENKNVGEVVINISTQISTKIKAEISYLTYQAGWSPIYDVRASNADKPVNLVYKANVYQKTGYSWNGVNLTISTGNPTANNNRPEMYPWYIDFFTPSPIYRPQLKSAVMNKSTNALQRSMEVEKDEDMELVMADEIGYEVEMEQSSISAEYSIDAEQDIPSDGKQHLVAIKEYELNTKFIYHAIPKLNPSAFLIAKIADYGNYNLLAGQSNLFFDGMYIGQSYLNPVTTVDSLLLSLGRDEKIIVKRNQLTDLTARQTLGSNIKETKAWEISVRNNNNFEIELDLMDQIPIGKNKEIEVKIDEISGAKYDEAYGSLLWKLKIKPSETKKVKLVYSVKYPKGKTVSGI